MIERFWPLAKTNDALAAFDDYLESMRTTSYKIKVWIFFFWMMRWLQTLQRASQIFFASGRYEDAKTHLEQSVQLLLASNEGKSVGELLSNQELCDLASVYCIISYPAFCPILTSGEFKDEDKAREYEALIKSSNSDEECLARYSVPLIWTFSYRIRSHLLLSLEALLDQGEFCLEFRVNRYSKFAIFRADFSSEQPHRKEGDPQESSSDITRKFTTAFVVVTLEQANDQSGPIFNLDFWSTF